MFSTARDVFWFACAYPPFALALLKDRNIDEALSRMGITLSQDERDRLEGTLTPTYILTGWDLITAFANVMVCWQPPERDKIGPPPPPPPPWSTLAQPVPGTNRGGRTITDR